MKQSRGLVALMELIAGAVTVQLMLTGCGLPAGGRTQTIEDGSVPYDLLGPAVDGPGSSSGDSIVARSEPVVFWLRPDNLLIPTGRDLSCEQAAPDVVRELLAALADAPTVSEREAGLASALPPTVELALTGLDAGVAEIEIGPLALGDAKLLPLAVGQVVLSVISAPGVDSVELVTSGRAIDLPLPDGALVDGPVSADQYASQLPARLAPSSSGAGQIGCPEPTT